MKFLTGNPQKEYKSLAAIFYHTLLWPRNGSSPIDNNSVWFLFGELHVLGLPNLNLVHICDTSLIYSLLHPIIILIEDVFYPIF